MSAMAVLVPIAGHILLVNFVVKAYEIPSEAMQPTLQVGDRILVDRTGIDGVNVGDIVVFHPPAGADLGTECGVPHPAGQVCPRPTKAESSQTFLKRVVALPGDELSIEDGIAVVNGERQNEPFVVVCSEGGICNLPKPITIPPDHYFLMGDNRPASDDSRFWGPVPESWIIGVAFARYSPLGSVSTF